MKFVKSVLVQLGIFLAYFMFANLLLLNRQGGTDILFGALTILCLIVHFIVVFVRFVRSKEKVSAGFISVFTVFILGLLFLFFVDDYLSILKGWK